LHVLAWASWWLFAVAMLGLAIVVVADPAPFDPAVIAEGGAFLIVLLPFPLAGVLILRRQPRNTVGWLLAGIGALWGLGGLADGYARYGLVIDPGSVPGPTVAATIGNGIWAPAIGVTGTFLFLLFPDGHLPGRHWRPVALLSGPVLVALTLCLYLSPDRLTEVPVRGVVNPLGIESMAPFLHAALDVLVMALAVCALLSVLALVTRFRRARGVERQQLKWLACAAAIVGGAFVLGIAMSLGIPDDKPKPGLMAVFDQLSFLSFSLIPIAIGIAVLRYRLYDIDLVINRTLVYGALTACLAAAYLTSVLVLRLALAPFTGSSDLAVAASTLFVAALFRPLRTRIQAHVDRRFYRRRYDATRTLEAFSVRLRHQVDLGTAGAELLAACRDTVQPAHASIWLSEGGRTR
jgi:hypothetical protein